MILRTPGRRFSKVAFLTSDRYPNLRRGPYGHLNDSHVSTFEKILGHDRVLTNTDDVAPHNIDWLKSVCGQSKVVLRPKVTEEVSEIMEVCSKDRLAVCPQGGNTGLVGGSVPVFDEVVISTSLMNRINTIDGIAGTVSCQAGVVLEKLEEALEPEGLMVPYDLGARGSCQVGGNISTCAGGLRLLRYGSMQANTLGIEAVLADGSVLNTMNSLKKDNTGYHLRQLFIGSEGTLGIVTQAVLQCPIRPRSVNLSFLNYDSSTFFMMIETHGSREDHDVEKMSNFVQEAMDNGLVVDGITANEPSRMTNLWHLRERAAESMCKDQFMFTYDITLPLENYYEAVEALKRRLKPFGSDVEVTGFGHIGDGNLHLNAVAPSYSQELHNAIEPFIFEWTASVGGSISAEHGMGFKKAKFLKYGKSPEAIRLMRCIKNSMDPMGILNPYKVLPW